MRVVLVCLLLAGCSVPGGDDPGADDERPTGFRTLGQGPNGIDVTADILNIIGNGNGWENQWKQTYGGEVPYVDFDKESVVWIQLGPRPTGGYAIEIESAQVEDGIFVIRSTETVPGDDCVVTEAETRPYHLVAAEGWTQGMPDDWMRQQVIVDC